MFILKKYVFAFLIILFFPFTSNSQNNKQEFDKSLLEEFELLNLCHCHEYLMMRHYDNVKWISVKAKKKRIEEEKYLVFERYASKGQFGLYYQQKYDSTGFYKLGLSIMLEEPKLNFRRLDSLFFEPLVQHYLNEERKLNPVPYLGLRHRNFYWDCFYRVKEIPLEIELKHFLQLNAK